MSACLEMVWRLRLASSLPSPTVKGNLKWGMSSMTNDTKWQATCEHGMHFVFMARCALHKVYRGQQSAPPFRSARLRLSAPELTLGSIKMLINV